MSQIFKIIPWPDTQASLKFHCPIICLFSWLTASPRYNTLCAVIFFSSLFLYSNGCDAHTVLYMLMHLPYQIIPLNDINRRRDPLVVNSPREIQLSDITISKSLPTILEHSVYQAVGHFAWKWILPHRLNAMRSIDYVVHFSSSIYLAFRHEFSIELTTRATARWWKVSQ